MFQPLTDKEIRALIVALERLEKPPVFSSRRIMSPQEIRVQSFGASRREFYARNVR